MGFVEPLYAITVATCNYLILFTQPRGQTVLHYALSCQKDEQLDLVKMLLERGANPNIQDIVSISMWLYGCLHETEWLAYIMHRDCVMSLIKLLTLLWNWQDGLTPLMKAVAVGHEESTKLLLQKSCCVNLQENVGLFSSYLLKTRPLWLLYYIQENGWSVLHIATNKGRADVVKLLIDYSADIDFTLKDKVCQHLLYYHIWVWNKGNVVSKCFIHFRMVKQHYK